MSDSIPAFARHLVNRSPRTVATYVRIVTAFASFAGIDDYSSRIPTVGEIEAFVGRPRLDGARRSPAGRNQELAALKAFAAFGKRELGWPAEQVEQIDDMEFEFTPRRDRVFLTAPELRHLFAVAGASVEPAQAAMVPALVALLSHAALRVSEVAGLNVSQVDLEGSSIQSVLGKRGTVRHVQLNAPTVALLRAWLDIRAMIAPSGESALFLSRRKGRLSVRSTQLLVTKLRRAMGTSKRLSPHPLRHTGATLMLLHGADISTVGSILGHQSLNTTRVYLHLVDLRQRHAVNSLADTIPAHILPSMTDRGGTAARLESPQNSAENPLDVQQHLDEAA